MAKQTPLYDQHVACGARMVDFHGWMMPLHYGSQIEEHHAVRSGCGLFDVSHMLPLDIRGENVRAFLRRLVANNVDKLQVSGKALYSCMLNEAGGVIDDLIIYFMDENWFRLVVNAGTAKKDLSWLRSHAPSYGIEVRHREDLGILAVQGPNARQRVLPLLPAALQDSAAALENFQAVRSGETFVGRTGYTGEDGFELVFPAAESEKVFRRVVDAGAKPCGLGARDTLRLEAAMRLYGNDIDESTTVLEADLGWVIGWDKRDFIGRARLLEQKEKGVARRLVGFEMTEPGIARHGHQVSSGGRRVGVVTSGTQTPYLKKAIGMAYVPTELSAPGGEIAIEIRGRTAKGRIVPLPFYRRPRGAAAG